MAQSPEQKKSYAVIKKFLGLNTKANRTAITDEEFSWLENAMPIGYANLKVVPTYSNMNIEFAETVIAMFGVNIGKYDYLLAFEADGWPEYVNLQTLTKGNVGTGPSFTGSPTTATASAGTLYQTSGINTFHAAGTTSGLFSVGMLLVGEGIPPNTYISQGLDSGYWMVSQYTGSIGPTLVTGVEQQQGFTSVSQWKNELAIILDAKKGYFTWDGTDLVTVGSLSGIGIVNGGTGFTSPPTITISAPDQTGGKQATATCTVTNTAGQITNILVTSTDSGFYACPKIIIADPPAPGITATASSSILSKELVSISITNPGSGYTSAPLVTVSGGGGIATATATIDTGSINSILITDAGSGYTTAPTVTISGGNGSNASLVAGPLTFAQGAVAVEVTDGGSGYINAANVIVTITGDGTNAAGTAIVAGGQITQVIMTNPGQDYSTASVTISGGGGNIYGSIATYNSAVSVMNITIAVGGGIQIGQTITGPNVAANTVIVSKGTGTGGTGTYYVTPPGQTVSAEYLSNVTNAKLKAVVTKDQCTGIQSFSGRVWIAQGRTVYYTAAGSATDFISVSSGNIELNDATLHGNISALLSANNFLYVFGDDSINVFSDVRVTDKGTTLFTNTNISASIGSKRPYSIFPYFRSILFANDYGMYALVGSTTTKISDALDGMFPDINFASPVYGAQVLLNNILCASFNFQYNGQGGTGSTYPGRYMQAVFFDKKWFFTSGLETMPYMVSAPVNGKITTYGSDGTYLYQLYSDANSNVSSYIQTALMPMGDPIRTKQALKFGLEATAPACGDVTITVDSETNSSPAYTVTGQGIEWVNNSGNTVTWKNNANSIVAWNQSGSAYFLYKSDGAQWGKYIGLTIETEQPQFIVNTVEFEHELRTRF